VSTVVGVLWRDKPTGSPRLLMAPLMLLIRLRRRGRTRRQLPSLVLTGA
jgi:hypothetical protein